MADFSIQPLAPLDALEFFDQKQLVDPKVRFDYRDVMRGAHAGSAVVAKMMQDALLRDTYALIRKKLADGLPRPVIEGELERLFKSYGWWGQQELIDPLTGKRRLVQLGSRRRIRIILDTNIRMAYAAGRWRSIQANKEFQPYLLYDAVNDERTRPDHAAWDGTILPVDHPFWQTHYPPNGWRCRCKVIPLTPERAAALGGVSADPKIRRRGWENKRTGLVERIPIGIDPGFDYNVGIAWRGRPGGLPPVTPPPRPVKPKYDGPGKTAINKAFQNAPLNVQRALERMPPLRKWRRENSHSGFYHPSHHDIVIPNGREKGPILDQTVRHEIGHALDFRGGGRNAPTPASFDEVKIIQEEGEALYNKTQLSDHPEKFARARSRLVRQASRDKGGWRAVADQKLTDAGTSLRELEDLMGDRGDKKAILDILAALEVREPKVILQKLPQDRRIASFSDYLGAVTMDRIQGPYHHGVYYYVRWGGTDDVHEWKLGVGNTTEAFANFVSLEGSKNRVLIAILQELTPATIGVFRVMLENMGREIAV